MVLKANWVDGDTSPTQHATAHNDAASNINTLVAKAPTYYILASDRPAINNNATFVGPDYTGMQASLAASTSYFIDGLLLYDCTETADCRVRFDMTQTPTVFGVNAMGLVSTAGSGSFTSSVQLRSRSANTNFIVGGVGLGTSFTVALPYKGVITTGSASVLTIQYNQSVAEVSDLIIRAGSYLRVALT